MQVGRVSLKAKAAVADAVQAAVAKVADASTQKVWTSAPLAATNISEHVDSPSSGIANTVWIVLPAQTQSRWFVQAQRPADPRAITFQEVNHTPLALPSAAAEALRGAHLLSS